MLIKTKKELREHFIDLRNGFDADYRIKADKAIALKLLDTPEYSDSKHIFVYVSVGNEVDTRFIIETSLMRGKNVAVPFCKNNEMYFYRIDSLNDLTCKQFGILTVDPEKSKLVTDFTDALCVVPALSFDISGNRLGYGGGYYDRFLAGKHIKTVGLCREKQMCRYLPSDDYDIKIKTIINENKIVQI